MTDKSVIGVDLNGLLDAAAFDMGQTGVVGGDVPSVVLTSVGTKGSVNLTTGREATLSMVGRGWDWPIEARSSEGSDFNRIPVAEIIKNLGQQENFNVGNKTPAEMMAESIKALAERRAQVNDQPVIIAIPDDGRFNEDAQDKLINAIRPTGMNVQLLWRSVATVLGMAKDLIPYVDDLDGRDIAVISLLEDGISVNRLTMTKSSQSNNGDNSYVVPKRLGPGQFFQFERKILDIALSEATTIAREIGADPRQILWGDGLPLRWLLHLPDKDAVLQTKLGWVRVPGNKPKGLEQVEISDEQLANIDAAISEVAYLIYEGPSLETTSAGKLLVYRVRDYLLNSKINGRRRQSLRFVDTQEHNSARGCVEFGRRQIAGEKTYLDYLPQLELAVRKGDEAVFKDLIPAGAECEGGTAWEEPVVDDDFSIPAGAPSLNFYLLREGTPAPRFASETLRTSPTQTVPTRILVKQVPAQGRARLTIEARDQNQRFPAINVNWDNMKIEEGKTREDIVESLEQADIKVPPVQPHPCHAFLWIYKPKGTTSAFSLKDRVEELAKCIDETPDKLSPEMISETRKLLQRYNAPSVLTRSWGADRHPDITPSRAIHSNGDLPEPSEDLPTSTFDNFDKILEKFERLIVDPNLKPKLRNQIVTFCTWAFLRCPNLILDHLRLAAENFTVTSVQNDFYAMGRGFSKNAELKAYFSLLLKHTEEPIGKNEELRGMKVYHANSLFHVLSLRENAPQNLTNDQAIELTELTIARLEVLISQHNYKAAMRTCLRAIGGLVRYRLVKQQFLTNNEEPGKSAHQVVRKIIETSSDIPERGGVKQLAEDVLTVLEERGVPDTILQWDVDESDDDG